MTKNNVANSTETADCRALFFAPTRDINVQKGRFFANVILYHICARKTELPSVAKKEQVRWAVQALPKGNRRKGTTPLVQIPHPLFHYAIIIHFFWRLWHIMIFHELLFFMSFGK